MIARGLSELKIQCSLTHPKCGAARDLIRQLSIRQLKSEFPTFKPSLEWDVPEESEPFLEIKFLDSGKQISYPLSELHFHEILQRMQADIQYRELTYHRTELLDQQPEVWWRLNA